MNKEPTAIKPPEDRCTYRLLPRALSVGLAAVWSLGWVLVAWPVAVCAADVLVIKQGEEERSLAGKVLVTAEDGGLLFQTPDGVLWPIQPDEIVSRGEDETPFLPLDADAMEVQLRESLPSGFRVHRTAHYMICHYTSQAYAEWCGSLLERLYQVFHTYWGERQLRLHEPEFPMVAVVFADQAGFVDFAEAELGPATSQVKGYYSLKTNRVTMYDLTGLVAGQIPDDKDVSVAQVTRALSNADGEFSVATVVHEATHQVAYNCGLHARYADIPLWVSEGMAIYFETPDLKSRRGWKTVGALNKSRLDQFKQYLPSRGDSSSIQSLVVNDSRFKEARQAPNAYAEAWALHYFLLRKKPDEYAGYLQKLTEKKPFFWDEEETRLQMFVDAFGDLETLNKEFLQFLRPKLR